MMTLKKFKVINFRSIEDSGWVETDDVNALIGTNESGKTNVLLPLWKLNPAKEGSIVPTADYPRKFYNEFRHKEPKPIFIRAIFEVGDDLEAELTELTGLPKESIREVEVARRFDGNYVIDFPNASPPTAVKRDEIFEVLQTAHSEIETITPHKSEEGLKKLLLSSLTTARESLPAEGTEIGAEILDSILATLAGVKTENAPKTSSIVPRHKQTSEDIKALQEEISRPHPRDIDDAVDLIKNNLPKFVFYSTYGNLDSEIYLPHVIANMARKDLGTKEQAKARTLRVLFEFVKLSAKEISELGRDFKDPNNRQPTQEEIEAIAEKKKQRSILLQSASTLLTKEFRSWWKQGVYRFRFEADGDHFRIWVSDDKRPEEIELEGRSTGLQWFLSFYLVFLVERADAHEGAIILLDEPGVSLHPLAQRDLSQFFDGLAKDNQLIYTAHSPFLVDADRLDRARKVFVAEDGTSKVSSDLRAADGDISQRGAAYAVHAAVGLSVAESLLIGCTPVVVEGSSDQHYLAAIKNVLIAAGRLKPGREIVFPPAGGVKGVRAVASILYGRDEELPVALFDSDAQGKKIASELRQGLYVDHPDLVLNVEPYAGFADSEVEDLIPPSVLVPQLDRLERTAEIPFADVYKSGMPIVPQIEAWAAKNKLELSKGWKVELAKRVKKQLLADGLAKIPNDVQERWTKLFETFAKAKGAADAQGVTA